MTRGTAVSNTAGDVGPSSIDRRRKKASKQPSAAYIERRDKLLAAAAEVIRMKGLDAASMNDIAEQFGSDRASVYYYYSSKQEIFQALVRNAVEENVLIAEEIAGSSDASSVRLKRIVESLLGAYERQYPLMHLYIQEDMRRAGPELQELARRFETAISQILNEGITSGEFTAELDPQVVAMAVLGAVNWTHRWFVPGKRLSGAEIGSTFASLFLDGLSNHETKRKVVRTPTRTRRRP